MPELVLYGIRLLAKQILYMEVDHWTSLPTKDCPLLFSVSRHNSPTRSFGRHGSGQEGFIQPCSLAMGRDNQIYVMDTGNSRIKVLDADLVFSHHITCPQLEGRSVTGERWRDGGGVLECRLQDFVWVSITRLWSRSTGGPEWWQR